MNRRVLKSTLLGLMLSTSTLSLPAAPLPRVSPDFSINDLSGKSTLLSSFKGKVVVLEFLFVKSQHCLRVAQMLNKLQAELGPSGFQAVGVAFDAPNAALTGGQYVTAMADSLMLT